MHLFTKANYPPEWKTATLVHMFKKGTHTKPCNYKPIPLTWLRLLSILSLWLYLITACISSQITWLLNSMDLETPILWNSILETINYLVFHWTMVYKHLCILLHDILNLSKCEHLTITNKCSSLMLSDYYIEGSTINKVNFCKYLGVTITNSFVTVYILYEGTKLQMQILLLAWQMLAR